MIFHIGQQIGNYKIISNIAQGTYANVYKAAHSVMTSRVVALKILLQPIESKEDEASNALYQEAHILEHLQHPHILALIDFGTYEQHPYIVKEYAVNGSLRDQLRTQAQSYDEAISILHQVGEALQYAHQQQIIHCDLKPENILFNAQHDALVADFDIAKVARTARSSVTSLGGTPAYMAPEQFNGKAYAGSDQYALACIAYEMLTGQRPFQGKDAAELRKAHLNETPIPPTQVNIRLPQHIDQALLRALEKDVRKRYPSIADLIEALDPLRTEIEAGQWARPETSSGPHLLLNGEGKTKVDVGDDIFYDATVIVNPADQVGKAGVRRRKTSGSRTARTATSAPKAARKGEKAKAAAKTKATTSVKKSRQTAKVRQTSKTTKKETKATAAVTAKKAGIKETDDKKKGTKKPAAKAGSTIRSSTKAAIKSSTPKARSRTKTIKATAKKLES